MKAHTGRPPASRSNSRTASAPDTTPSTPTRIAAATAPWKSNRSTSLVSQSRAEALAKKTGNRRFEAYALAGALTGFVVGLTGVGGGALPGEPQRDEDRWK